MAIKINHHNNQQIKEEIITEIKKKHLEKNVNFQNTTHPQTYRMQLKIVVLGGKFMVIINAYIKNKKGSQVNNLIFYLKRTKPRKGRKN